MKVSCISFFAVLFSVLLFACSNDGNYSVNGSKADYKGIAEMIKNGEVSDEELEAKNFGEEESRLIMKEFALLNGISEENFESMLKEPETQKNSLSKIEAHECSQSVEVSSGTQGQTYAFSYYIDEGCDNDPNDQDWTLQFNTFGAPVDPDKVKWWAGWVVRTAFNLAYGGNLLACNLCSYPIEICLGTNGVTLAGGISNVQSSLYIWHQ